MRARPPMTPEQQAATLDELIRNLEGAYLVRVAPPSPAGGELVRLSEMIDQAAAKVPAKYRAELLKLERRIRGEVERVHLASLEAGNLVSLAGAASAARWAYQSGALTALLLSFISRPVPAPAKGGGR